MEENLKHIIPLCIRGNRAAQQKLYEMHKVFLFGICMRYTQSKAEAEDMLMEGFYRILKDIKQYSGKSSLKSWMRRVIINSCLMHIRKHRKVQFTELHINETYAVEPSSEIHEMSDRAQMIIALVRQLPVSYQTVFNLKAMDGFNFREISEMLQINEATLRSHYLRARKKLQSLLQKELH